MKIAICGSIHFIPEIKRASDFLERAGHLTVIPFSSEKIVKGELSLEKYKKIKDGEGDKFFREEAERDLIKEYFEFINDSDAILVVNCDKNGIKNYIGGNTFLEIGFAHVLDKKIYLLNEIPDISYKDELLAMEPIILSGNLSILK